MIELSYLEMTEKAREKRKKPTQIYLNIPLNLGSLLCDFLFNISCRVLRFDKKKQDFIFLKWQILNIFASLCPKYSYRKIKCKQIKHLMFFFCCNKISFNIAPRNLSNKMNLRLETLVCTRQILKFAQDILLNVTFLACHHSKVKI